MAHLKEHLQSELDYAIVNRSAADAADLPWKRDVRGRIAEAGHVREVEELDPELGVESFTDLRVFDD
jgi:hypothetical protein